jgi:formylglycine-generating enzyme required for sulfatase activity
MKSSIIRSVLAVLFISATAHAQCPGDIVPNGVVNGTDLAEVLASWGPCSSCNADTNGDGQVNGQDLAAVLGGWGPCRPIITSISPNQGVPGGGALITISGHYLAGTTSVTIGGAAATPVTVVSTNTIRVVTPPGILGPKDVSLDTSAGSVSIADGFTYVNVMVPMWATLIQAEPDPTIVFDPEMVTAIGATGHAWRVRDIGTGIEMVLIPPGTFQMGCSPSNQYACEGDESPRHTVTLTMPFYLGRFEVRQSEWQGVMGTNPSFFQGSSYPDSANRPVEQVSWNTIQGFLSATGMRLPTEAEWEYSCRAGTSTAFHSFAGYPAGIDDDALLVNIAWTSANSGNRTRPVGQKLGNALGLHDMHGNVWEWVSDYYSSGYYAVSPESNPTGPASGGNRAFRGGRWFNDSYFCRTSFREDIWPDYADGAGGFRVARNP